MHTDILLEFLDFTFGLWIDNDVLVAEFDEPIEVEVEEICFKTTLIISQKICCFLPFTCARRHLGLLKILLQKQQSYGIAVVFANLLQKGQKISKIVPGVGHEI